jgi:hypothetical protein
VLWLLGDEHSLIVAATEAGNLRRISLDPGANGVTLLSQVTSPLHTLICLAYSDALKLVGYTSGNGDAALLACIARMPMRHYFGKAATVWSRFVPRANLVSTGAAGEGAYKVLWGASKPCAELYEVPRSACPCDWHPAQLMHALLAVPCEDIWSGASLHSYLKCLRPAAAQQH